MCFGACHAKIGVLTAKASAIAFICAEYKFSFQTAITKLPFNNHLPIRYLQYKYRKSPLPSRMRQDQNPMGVWHLERYRLLRTGIVLLKSLRACNTSWSSWKLRKFLLFTSWLPLRSAILSPGETTCLLYFGMLNIYSVRHTMYGTSEVCQVGYVV